jgi:CheY-like chemotaxis protein
MNLVTNASQSMKEKGGTLTVTLGSEVFPPTLKKKDSDLAPGKYIKLTISDTGHGIAIEDRKRIFDPYYTTKAQGMGTGLGLSVAQSIVKKHGGTIQFSSKSGVGTDFFIYLPVMDKKKLDNQDDAPEISSLLPVGSERILLVDDEETIIDTGREMLEYLGYSVEIFNSSLSALTQFETSPDRYDLIISDMTMPEMNGDELAKKMIAIRPDIPIIICTGYNPKIDEATATALGLKAFIFKPLTFQKLAVTVRGVLDGLKPSAKHSVKGKTGPDFPGNE